MIQSTQYERVKRRTWKLSEEDIAAALRAYVLANGASCLPTELHVEILADTDDCEVYPMMVGGKHIATVTWERRDDVAPTEPAA